MALNVSKEVVPHLYILAFLSMGCNISNLNSIFFYFLFFYFFFIEIAVLYKIPIQKLMKHMVLIQWLMTNDYRLHAFAIINKTKYTFITLNWLYVSHQMSQQILTSNKLSELKQSVDSPFLLFLFTRRICKFSHCFADE